MHSYFYYQKNLIFILYLFLTLSLLIYVSTDFINRVWSVYAKE